MQNLVKDVLVKHEPIDSIEHYIEVINKYQQKTATASSFLVYRGEPKVYPTSCMPNIFRKKTLYENRFYEKNIYDTMRQNGITDRESYLEIAIDAQHDEFPSRLLDVSYNCMSALYFATTPSYHLSEDEYDSEDGAVYLINVEEIYSPSAKNAKDTFDAIINKSTEWIDDPIFSYDHKFIDYSKQNARIIAQQGAFILFQGNSFVELPSGMRHQIIISARAKKKIRKQLQDLFGIHTGTIYPEATNMVDTLKKKSMFVVDNDFSYLTELERSLKALKRELYYYLDYQLRNSKIKQEVTLSIIIEKIINNYKKELCRHLRTSSDKQVLKLVIEQSKETIMKFCEDMDNYCDISIDCSNWIVFDLGGEDNV